MQRFAMDHDVCVFGTIKRYDTNVVQGADGSQKIVRGTVCHSEAPERSSIVARKRERGLRKGLADDIRERYNTSIQSQYSVLR